MIATVRADKAGGFYVYWEDGVAYGSQGSGLDYDSAVRLAEELREGNRRPLSLAGVRDNC